MAIADEHATFGVTCRRWNIGLADGGTQRLPRIVGYRRAMELIITGRVIDAEEAHRIGLVNEVVPSGTCVDRAVELGERIAALPQPAIHTDHEAVVRGFGRPLDEGLRIEAECFNRLLETPEILEGLRRFNERDHPDRDGSADALTPGISRPRSTAVCPPPFARPRCRQEGELVGDDGLVLGAVVDVEVVDAGVGAQLAERRAARRLDRRARPRDLVGLADADKPRAVQRRGVARRVVGRGRAASAPTRGCASASPRRSRRRAASRPRCRAR